MSRKEEIYKPALVGKNIPILTLDNKWHRLFTQTEISPEIKEKEKELNELLKRQGKLNHECKKLRSIKVKLRDEIVSLMDGGNETALAQKKQEENKRLIEDCNVRLEADQDELLDIEKEISWIKTTNRPYLTIEAMVNELADRKNVIFESVKDLIAL